jgi:hypothetical protein
MKPRGPAVLGAAIGIAAAMLLLGYMNARASAPRPVMFPDSGGRVRGAVMQYSRGNDAVVPVFQQYLSCQDSDLTVYMVCPEAADFAEISTRLPACRARLVPVYTHHPITAWSRDRWVALEPLTPGKSITLLAPKGEQGADVWPQRAGDAHVAEDLARALPEIFAARRSPLFFDGGDFLADGNYVFATRALLDRNLQHTVTARENLVEAISRDLQLTPVVMDNSPNHHAGMFMMSAGPDPQDPARRVMVVADPSLGKQYYTPGPEFDAALTGGPGFATEMQRQFDNVADLCRQKNYRVVRIPVVPALQGKMYLTYVNVILDRTPAGKPLVYMSSYSGQEKLNTAAAAVWQSLGYEVRPIDCTSVWQAGGTLHCLVNVFQRDP